MTDDPDPLVSFRTAGEAAERKKTGAGAEATETRVDFTALVSMQSLLIQAIQALTTTLQSTFPKATGTAATATGGAGTLPANPVGFIVTTLPGTTTVVRIPYYS